MSKKNLAKVEVIPPFMTAHKDPKTGEYDKFSGLSKDFVKSVLLDARTVGEWKLKAADKLEQSLNVAIAYNAYKQAGGKGLPHFVHTHLDSSCPEEYGKENSPIRSTINGHTVFNGVRYMIEQIARPVLTGQKTEQKLVSAGVNPKDDKAVRAYTKGQRETAETQFRADVVAGILEVIELGAVDSSIDTVVRSYPGMVNKEDNSLKKRGKDLHAQIMDATNQFYLTQAGVNRVPPSAVPGAMSTKTAKAKK